MRSIFSAVMMWATLAGGAGPMPGAAAGVSLRDGLMRHQVGYVSSWDGQRISAQAMRHVW